MVEDEDSLSVDLDEFVTVDEVGEGEEPLEPEFLSPAPSPASPPDGEQVLVTLDEVGSVELLDLGPVEEERVKGPNHTLLTEVSTQFCCDCVMAAMFVLWLCVGCRVFVVFG